MKRRLALGGRLDRYVGRLFAASYLTAFLMVVGLFIVIDLSDRMNSLVRPEEEGGASAAEITRFYVLGVPFIYLQVAPFVTLLAALFTTARLLRYNEATAALTAGISARRLSLPVFVGGAIVAAAMFGLRELVTDALGFERFLLEDRLTKRRESPVFERILLKDRHANLVYLQEFRLGAEDGTGAVAVGLNATLRKPGGGEAINAERALFVPDPSAPAGGTWRLVGGLREDLHAPEKPREPVELLEGIEFSPNDVIVAHKDGERPLELSSREVRGLARRDPDNVKYRTLLQHHLTFPLANLALVLVALPLVLGRPPGRRTVGLVLGFMLCVFYCAMDFVARSLGISGQLGPLVAAWLPLLFFSSLGAVLFAGMRT